MNIITDVLGQYRSERNFNVVNYVNLKVQAIRKHFEEHNLDAAVIGISGGVDSAVTYSLLLESFRS